MTTILLLDDEPQMGVLVAMCIESLGARLVHTMSLDETVVAARTEQPSVVLLDLQLAHDDGLSYLPTLRDEPALQSVPILAFTVHDSRRYEALAKGVDGFIAKPFGAEALRDTLRRFLDAPAAL